jgi:acyl dehydratase
MASSRTLGSPPRILPLYARASASLLPGASLLPFLGGRGGELPELELELAEVRVDAERLAAYAHVCGFALRDALPVTYPHVLAFGLQLALMTDRRFPFGAVGLVHLRNRIVQHRPLALGEPLALRVRTTPLQPHRKGQTFGIATEARVGEELVWEEHSTMLRRGRGTGEATPADPGATPEDPAAPAHPQQTALWRVPGDQGRRYAAVSGDRNPIHMHALSAKLLGFPRAIAHGMWTKARCVAALERRLPERFAVAVEFRRPIVLPAEVAFGERERDARDAYGAPGAIDFAVWDAGNETRHLDGSIEPRGEERA